MSKPEPVARYVIYDPHPSETDCEVFVTAAAYDALLQREAGLRGLVEALPKYEGPFFVMLDEGIIEHRIQIQEQLAKALAALLRERSQHE